MIPLDVVLFWIALVVVPVGILLAAIGAVDVFDATAGYLRARRSWL